MKTIINTIKGNEKVQATLFFGSVLAGFAILGYYIFTAGTAPCFGF
jgi:hypothetical protein